MQYYQTMVKKKDYNVDVELIKKYFPISKVKSGILRLYQHLLALKFEKVQNAEVWFDDVEMVIFDIFVRCFIYLFLSNK